MKYRKAILHYIALILRVPAKIDGEPIGFYDPNEYQKCCNLPTAQSNGP